MDLYLSFEVFSYNLSICSGSGFTPLFLTFGLETRLHPDIVYGILVPAFENVSADSYRTSGTPLILHLKSFSVLSHAFALVEENFYSFYKLNQ